MTTTCTVLRSARRERLARLQVLQDRRTAEQRTLLLSGKRTRRPADVPPVGFEPTLSVV